MADKEKGWIKFFNISRQFGFIVYGEDDVHEIYFSGDNITTAGWVPRQGQGCRFVPTKQGSRERAEMVTRE